MEIKNRGLREKHIKSKRNTKQQTFMTKECKDEEERSSYIRQKKKEKLLKKRKEEAIELSKRAWGLSKLHYSLSLLQKILRIWKAFMNERYLLLTKAIGFSNQLLLSKYFFGLYHHIKDQQLHDDRMKFQNAGMSKLHLYFISSPKHILTIIVINFFLIDKYCELRLCETVLFCWRKVTRYQVLP